MQLKKEKPRYSTVKSIGIRLLKLAITVGVFFWIIHQFGWHRITTILSTTQHRWWIIGIGMSLVSIFFGSFQWYLILRNKNIPIGFFSTLRIYFTGFFLNNFILGLVAGDAYKVAALHFGNKDGKASFAATFLDRLAGLLALSLFALGGGLIILVDNLQQGKEFLQVFLVLALFSAIFLGIFFMTISARLQNIARFVIERIPWQGLKRLVQPVLEETFLNRRGRKDRLMILHVFILSLIIQALRVLVHVFSAQALGILKPSTVHYFFVIVPVVALLMLIPMPFGVREIIGGFLYSNAGFVNEEAIVMQFLATIIGVSSASLGGIFFLCDTTTFSRKKVLPQQKSAQEPKPLQS